MTKFGHEDIDMNIKKFETRLRIVKLYKSLTLIIILSDHEQEHGRGRKADRIIRQTLKTVQIFGQICPVSVRSLGSILIQFKVSVFLVHFCLHSVRWPFSVWNYKKNTVHYWFLWTYWFLVRRRLQKSQTFLLGFINIRVFYSAKSMTSINCSSPMFQLFTLIFFLQLTSATEKFTQ